MCFEIESLALPFFMAVLVIIGGPCGVAHIYSGR